jgi:hypothetical protein
MAGDRVARSVPKFIYIRVGGQIRWIYPPLNKPKTLAAMALVTTQLGHSLLQVSNLRTTITLPLFLF